MHEDVTVRDVMTREYVGVSESDGVRETVSLLVAEGAESAVVLRGVDPVGLVTRADVLELVADGIDPEETAVSEIMTADPPSVAPEHTVLEAADVMSAANTEALLVLADGGAAGVLSERDLLAATRLASGTAATANVEPSGPPATRGNDAAEQEPPVEAVAGDAYSSQSICEACGALTRDLADVNGQLLCADCRDI